MSTVAFVTIRLNSKRLPNKNILLLGDHPLAWYICSTLLNCKTIDNIYIYCSEERIMDYLPVDPRLRFLKREKRLDGDQILAQDTYSAFVKEVDADIYIAALTTAPFIRPETIDSAVLQVQNNGFDSAFSAQRLQTFAWYNGKPLNYMPESIPRTQDLQPIYIETSGFFVFKKDIWNNYRRRIGFNPFIQLVDDIQGIDIDTKEDYEFAKKLMEIGAI